MARRAESGAHRDHALSLNADIDLPRRLCPIDNEPTADPDVQHQSLSLKKST
jgi:hypothetical protein